MNKQLEKYKTSITIYLNGTGVLYYVKTSIDKIEEVLRGRDKITLMTFKEALNNSYQVIDILTVNFDNCASVEFQDISTEEEH